MRSTASAAVCAENPPTTRRPADAVLLAAVGGPKWDTTDPAKPRPEQGLLVLRKSLGLGYIKPEFAAVGSGIEIEILGERKRATVLVDSPYDPENKDLRA